MWLAGRLRLSTFRSLYLKGADRHSLTVIYKHLAPTELSSLRCMEYWIRRLSALCLCGGHCSEKITAEIQRWHRGHRADFPGQTLEGKTPRTRSLDHGEPHLLLQRFILDDIAALN
jgi:hypothetical protein